MITVSEIAGIIQGKLYGTSENADYRVSHLLTDSRSLLDAAHSVFFALRGARNDGHQFVPELAEKGVRVFVVAETGNYPIPRDVFLIEVSDTLKALQRLAACHRSRFHFPVIGITGSNGKTVIKEWLNDLLSDDYSIVRNPKSYNSQIGVPLSVWLMQPGNNLGIFEAGISKPGEMRNLAGIIRPAIGVFTNIGDAHQENFTSLKQKTEEKLLLFHTCEQLIFCQDQPEVACAAIPFCERNHIKSIPWSLKDPGCPLFFELLPRSGGTGITACYNNRHHSFFIPFADFSSVENSCHCFAAILALGLDPSHFIAKFLELAPLSMRLEMKRGINNSILVNDTYNSDINSLEIALSVLNQQAENKHVDKVVILSDIRQSGFSNEELYRRVNTLLLNAGVGRFIGIGTEITRAAGLFRLRKNFYPTTGDFLNDLKKTALSETVILIKGAREFRFEDISSALQLRMHQTVLEINLNRLTENLNIFKSLLRPQTRIMVMVKAFSYGSGDVEIARLLRLQRVDYLAVAVADEGIELRNAGIDLPIIVMNPEPHSFQQMIDFRLEPNLYSLSLAGEFAQTADLNALNSYPVHLKIDTGMNRLGLKDDEEITRMVELLRKNATLKVQSVFSHLAAADDPGMDAFTLSQIRRFEEVSKQISLSLGYPVIRHILNSAGIERFPAYQFEMVRLGIGLYGITCSNLPLKPISRLRSIISQIKQVRQDETIGYNRSGIVNRDSRIAIIPVGYADGLDRRLGNRRGKIYIKGHYAGIVGNVCMDMCMADVTGIECQSGDEAEIFGDHITVREMAEMAGTIPYEILTGISQRVKRIYIQE